MNGSYIMQELSVCLTPDVCGNFPFSDSPDPILMVLMCIYSYDFSFTMIDRV